jgi:hypothetical protein
VADTDDGARYQGIVGEYMRLIMDDTEADPHALVVGLLTSIGASVGRRLWFEAGRTHHYCNLFSCLVGDTSAARKGTAMNEIRQLMRYVDPTFEPRVKSGLSTGEGLIDVIRDPREDDVKQKDGSVIRQIVDMGVDDKRLLVLEGELGQPLQAIKRETNTLSAILRLMWDGSPLRVMSRTTKNCCNEPHGAIFGAITPKELLNLLSSADRPNGLANRFLFVCTQRSKLLPFGGNVDRAALEHLAMRMGMAIQQAAGAQAGGRCMWSHDAAQHWKEIYPVLSGGRDSLIGAMTARAEVQVTRLAMLYAILNGSTTIHLAHLEAAEEVWRYCEESVRYIFDAASGNSDADKILSALSSHVGDGLSQTEISVHVFNRNRTATQIKAALNALMNIQRVRYEQRTSTEGRTETRWFPIS